MSLFFKPLLLLVCISSSGLLNAQAQFEQGKVWTEMGQILSQRDRVEPINRIVKDRLDNLLPQLMREARIDMWILAYREYQEDALFYTLVPQPTFAARRTTILVIYDRGEAQGLERMTISRYPIKGYYDSQWDGGSSSQQWRQLSKIVNERNPKRIGINTSKEWSFADGLSASLNEQLVNSIPGKNRAHIVSAENLVIRWMETRTQAEIDIYPGIVGLARRVIAEAFSNQVITPGVTTTDEVEWYIRERFEALQLRPWFQPHVNAQRKGDNNNAESPFFGETGRIIQPGDVLHTDVGICYLNLCTDTQEMGYVLKTGETSMPSGLIKALALGNQWQDNLTGQFSTGLTGNQILERNLKSSKRMGLTVSTYTHPIGFVGHAAGPTIGMWDNQGPTSINGDWKLYPNTAYAIEGNIKTKLAEWDNELIQIKLEQTALFDGQSVIYLAGRQVEWHIIKP